MKYIYRHHLNIINGSLSKALSNIIFFCIREGLKKKSAEFSALFKTHPPHSQSAEKKIKITWSKNHF